MENSSYTLLLRAPSQKEDNYAYDSLDKEKARWGSTERKHADGFLYDRASDSTAVEPCIKCHRETHYCKHRKTGGKRRGKLEHTSLMDIGHLADDMDWWEEKDHGTVSATQGFDDRGHLHL